MNKDQAFMQKWLKRLRKDLTQSGRLTELTMHLAGNNPDKAELWRAKIRAILEEEEKPSTEFVLAVDRWVTLKPKSTKGNKADNQLDLL